MDKQFWEFIVSQGVFATLFIGLFIHTIKMNKEREDKYQDIINKLADKISIVEDIKEDVKQIKEKIELR